MAKKGLLLFTVLLFLFSSSNGQVLDYSKLEKSINDAIQKVYPACVRMYGYDSVRRVQNSSQFSGVVVSAEGLILTVAHAVSPKRIYKVTFPDGRDCLALALGRIGVGANQLPDVAMMKIITTGPWPFAELGRSSSLKVDEACFGISYPESLAQLQPMVRFGSIVNQTNQWGFIESSCIMETGDSGGPLLDLNGRVIGLHSRINQPESVNYEVPIDLPRKYWTALQVAENYAALPSSEDDLNTETSVVASILLPPSGILSDDWKGEHGVEEKAITITSTLADSSQKINATVFVKDGLAKKKGNAALMVSKSSMVGKDPLAQLPNGKNIKAQVLARDSVNDLVLLSIDALLASAIRITSIDTSPIETKDLGKLLFSGLPHSDIKHSVIGSRNFTLPKHFNYGYLGAPAMFKNGKVTVSRINEASPAAKEGLAIGDTILSINGYAMNRPEDYGAVLMKYPPGEKVTIELERSGSTFSKVIELADQPSMAARHPADKFEGGKSIRRDGFEDVFVHDARIRSYECGNPVFDYDGHFKGINIARFSHTATVVIPAAIVYSFLIKNITN